MFRGDIMGKLRSFDESYRELRALWLSAVQDLRKKSEAVEIPSYKILDGPDDDELCFTIFGMKCFMRFKHNLEKGIIEYGVIKSIDAGGTTIREPLMSVNYDGFGNLQPPYTDYRIEHFNRAHMSIIEQKSKQFLGAAFDLGGDE